MIMLVGLGNPGSGYARNRHNIGFMAVDEIVRRHSFAPFKSKFNGKNSDGRIGTDKVVALKPMTFMNDSGRSVLGAMTFYKIAPEDVIVFHDELDLEAGKVRVKRGGGLAGHNGLRSIVSHIGKEFTRIRLGIGHPGDRGKVTSHVLKDFAKADEEWLDKLIPALADHADYLIRGDDGGYMNKVSLNLKPPRPNAARPEASSAPDSNTSKQEK